MTPLEMIIGGVIVFVVLIISFAAGKKLGEFRAKQDWERSLPAIRKDATKRSRAVLTGQFSEQLAPILPDFSWKPTEVRFLGKPIDFIAFRGLDERKVEEVIFVEVKTGQSKLSAVERSLRDAIREKRVSWTEYRPSEWKN